MKYDMVMFDLDGTVIDSKPGIFNALRYTLDRLGMVHPNEEFMNKFIGPSIGSSFKKLYGFSEEAAEEAVKIYREHYSTTGILQCDLYEGIKPLCEELCRLDVKVGLATKKPETYAKQILKNLKIDHLFHTICGSGLDELHDSKSHIIARCAESATKALMVGDTKYDIMGANDAKVDSVGVLYGYGTRDELEEYRATYITETVSTLRELILDMI